ncbi:MAG: SigB/SigF/SigG family RNA polymerase sigma factor [Firmicutes bacterium]|nr:SigB/SigF/SigG family RNA polymerase sigma factor [Bacillota bacterium]
MGKIIIAGVDTSTLPKLSNQKQLEMLEQIKNDEPGVRQTFIFANLRLVLSVIQKYIKKNVTDDVFQVGCVGLIKAIDNFDSKYGVQFSTYAVPMIIGEIRRFLRDNNSLRVSRSMRDTAYKALVAKEKLMHELDREPTIDELAIEIGASYKAVYFALNATSNTLSLDETVFDEGSKQITMMEKVPITTKESENWLEDVMLQKAIRALNIREREILLMRYFQGKTQVEVSQEVGISQAQVSRLEKNALDGVRKKLC